MDKKKKNTRNIILIIAGVIAVAAIAVVLIMLKNKDDYRVLKVESFTGTVDLSRNDKSEDLFEGMNLKSKDVVTTGKESMIGILADSDKHIIAEENTCFSIVSSGDEKKGSLSITLEYGTSLYTIDNKLNEDSSFDVNTPNAAMSVRGTTFKVCYDKDKNETTLDVTEGSVQVTTSTESKLIEAGNSINIIGDEGEIVEINKEEEPDKEEPDKEEVPSNKIVFKAGEGEEYAEFFTYVYDSENDGYVLTGYSENGYNKLITYEAEYIVEVTFPETYNGKAVVGIGAADETDNFSMSLWTMNIANQEWIFPDGYKYCNKLFEDNSFDANYPCEKLVAVSFNEGLESIADEAFRNCTALEEITIPSTVTKIGEGAFMGCTNLSVVNIEDGCNANIGYNTFADTNITSITLPGSITSINTEAFNDWDNTGVIIEKIIWNTYHTDAVIDGVGEGLDNVCIFYLDGMYFGAGEDAVKAIASTEDGITAFVSTDIPDNAFMGKGEGGAYKNLIVDEGVTSIGYNAFCNVTIPNIELPSTLKTVGSRAFKNVVTTELNLMNVTTAGELILQGATVDKVVINSLAFSGEALSGASIKELYINYTGGSLAKSATNGMNLDVLEHIYFSGSEEEWEKFIGNESGNNLTVSMDNITFNAFD